jgi:GTPase SAR1 family protein
MKRNKKKKNQQELPQHQHQQHKIKRPRVEAGESAADADSSTDETAATSTAAVEPPLVAAGGGQNYNDCYSLLVCSASGSGKSTLIKRFCSTPPLAQKPLYICCNNKTFDNDAEASQYAAELLAPNAKPISLTEAIKKLSHAVLVIEDIQNFNAAELILVKQLLFYCRRHRFLHLFFVCHVVLRSGLMNILNNFDAVVVLNNADNEESFMNIASKRRFTQPERIQKWQELRSSGRPYSMMVFTGGRNGRQARLLPENPNPTLDYLVGGDVDTSPVDRNSNLEKEAIEEMLNSFGSVEKRLRARALFKLIQNRQSEILDLTDYSVHMKNKVGRVMACSIFDYIAACLGELEPSLPVTLLHKYLRRKIVIPTCLMCVKMRKISKE